MQDHLSHRLGVKMPSGLWAQEGSKGGEKDSELMSVVSLIVSNEQRELP